MTVVDTRLAFVMLTAFLALPTAGFTDIISRLGVHRLDRKSAGHECDFRSGKIRRAIGAFKPNEFGRLAPRLLTEIASAGQDQASRRGFYQHV